MLSLKKKKEKIRPHRVFWLGYFGGGQALLGGVEALISPRLQTHTNSCIFETSQQMKVVYTVCASQM